MAQTSQRPRVLFLNRSYYPDAEATGQLLTQLCEDLASRFDVRVISGQPNSNPSGMDYVRYGDDHRNGVEVRRVWHSRFPKSSSLGRIANWMSYMVTAAFAAIRGPKPAIIVVETDPPLLCLLGWFLKHWFGCHLVVYLQDIYPDLGIAIGKLPDNWLIRSLRSTFLRVYRDSSRLIVLSDDMRQVLVESGIEDQKIAKIPNWVDCSQIRPVKQGNSFRDELGLGDQFIVMHSGNLGLCQGLEHVLEAAALLQDRGDISFVLVGDGAAKQQLVEDARAKGLQNVRFVDYQPVGRLSESLSAADLHLISVDPRVMRFLMPSKLYGALASGTPVIAIAPANSELARIVECEQVGRVASPNAPAALVDRIVELADLPYDFQEMGDRARKLAESRFDRRISVKAFSQLLTSVVHDRLSERLRSGSAHPDDSGSRTLAPPTETLDLESEDIAESPQG